jgi:hypothetical protein
MINTNDYRLLLQNWFNDEWRSGRGRQSDGVASKGGHNCHSDRVHGRVGPG